MAHVANAIRSWALDAPKATALRGADWSTSYGDLAMLIDEAALQLVLDGVSPGDVVHVPAHKTPITVAAIAATDRIGAAALVTSTDLGHDVTDRIVQVAGVRLSATPNPEDPSTPRLKRIASPAFASKPAAPPFDTHLILCTSGTTGDPKLVPLTRTATAAFMTWAVDTFAINHETVVASVAPLNFDISLLDLWATLVAGGTVQMVDATEVAQPAALCRHLDSGVEVLQAVPTTLRLLTKSAGAFPKLRHVISTGDAFPDDIIEELRRVFPAAELHNVYGATETNDSFCYTLPIDREASPGTVPIGTPLPGVLARLVTPEGEDLEGEGTGELLVSTPFASTGYLTEDGLDARSWSAGACGTKWYRTGDIAYRDPDGRYTCVDRAARIVKVRGVRTSLAAVETAIAGFPGVRQAAVIAAPDIEAGAVLHAFICADGNVDTLSLRTHCSRHLARTSLPSRYHVQTTPLPLNTNGKFDRGALLDRIQKKENVA